MLDSCEYGMMPRMSELDRKIEKPVLRIKDEPLLDLVYRGEEEDAAEGHIESEYELEHRYEPSELLSEEELEQLSAGESLEIVQGYIKALDENGAPCKFRLRTTWQVDRSTNKQKNHLLRIARKTPVEGKKGKREVQAKFSPDKSQDASDFTRFWNGHIRPSEKTHKTRYYIKHTLPNGHYCEIHYDIYHGRDMEGMPRIEVEFKGDHADEDARYVRERGAKATLPKWIGNDVTDDKSFGGSQIAKHGFPQKAFEHLHTLKEKHQTAATE